MPAKRIWAEQLPTELPCKKKILAKAIKNNSKLKAVLHRIPEASRVQPWEYDNEKQKSKNPQSEASEASCQVGGSS